jgi:hypothetical protein
VYKTANLMSSGEIYMQITSANLKTVPVADHLDSARRTCLETLDLANDWLYTARWRGLESSWTWLV